MMKSIYDAQQQVAEYYSRFYGVGVDQSMRNLNGCMVMYQQYLKALADSWSSLMQANLGAFHFHHLDEHRHLMKFPWEAPPRGASFTDFYGRRIHDVDPEKI